MDGDDSETFHAVCFGGRAPRSLDEPAFDDDDGWDGGADDVDGSPSSGLCFRPAISGDSLRSKVVSARSATPSEVPAKADAVISC